MEHLLAQVTKPLRYIGNELGSIHKDWDGMTSSNERKLKFVICYPDLYEIGMSYFGFRILYHLLNRRPDTLCERVFAPATDMEELLKKNNIPLFSLESHTPLKNFDCIGFSLQYELTYTNVLNILHLAGIPIHREERKESDPLIVAGGSCTLNPFPLSPFFDCLFIGEAEPVLPKFVELVKQFKGSREQLLKELSKISGIFVPGISKTAKRVLHQELSNDDFPNPWIVPFIEITRDTLVIEIARGCTRGCRFCQPGMTTRPYRERDLNSILELVKTGIKRTGYREVSLLSLSPSDHSQFTEIVKRIRRLNLNLSLPSMLGNSLTPELAELIGRGGITFAPEAGTDQLRERINKPITESQILNSCELASSHGFTHVKLYYMVGLPGETDKDIDGIIDLTLRISKIMRGKQINITLSPFIPKPHTPFQREPQETPQQLEQKIQYIKKSLRKSNIKIKHTNLFATFVEGILTRGDTQIAKVVEFAWQGGAKFDAWTDQFNFSYWEQAFEKAGVDPYSYLNSYGGGPLHWDVIDTGVKKDFLVQEHNKTTRTLDCRLQGCYKCGVCETPHLIPMQKGKAETGASYQMPQEMSYGRPIKRLHKFGAKIKLRYRVKFEKTEPLRFLGHLDLVRLITRTMVRANIPIAYSEGFTKRPKLSFSPPLPFGVTSKEEYFDMLLESPPPRDIKLLLNQNFPNGIRVSEVTILLEESPALSDKLKHCEYKIENINVPEQKIQEFISCDEVLLQGMNIRPFVLGIEKADGFLVLTMKIGKVKPWHVIEHLLGIPEAQALQFKIERSKYC